MAEYKGEIRPKQQSDGSYPDIFYPKTTADMVFDEETGQTVAEHLVDDVRHVTQQEKDNWNSKLDSSDLTGFIPTSEKGSPNGVATLNNSGDIPSGQLNNAIKVNMPSGPYYYNFYSGAPGRETESSWTKVFEIRVGIGGTFETKITVGATTANKAYGGQVRIRRNGISVGTLRNYPDGESSNVEYTQVISGWKPNDLFQVYTRRDSGRFTLRRVEINVAGPIPTYTVML